MARSFKARDVDWLEIDGQTQKIRSIQDRKRAYAQLRKHGIEANGTIWTRLQRRVAALFY